jgi:hypothetical protein
MWKNAQGVAALLSPRTGLGCTQAEKYEYAWRERMDGIGMID